MWRPYVMAEPHLGDHHSRHTRCGRSLDHLWRKVYVSRLVEAHRLVVSFRDPDGQISAAILDATTPGLSREPIKPPGLAGWSWGVVRLHQVPVDPSSDLSGAPGTGLNAFHGHFARFRPLVTATALGVAAQRAYRSKRGAGCPSPDQGSTADTGQRADHRRPYSRRPDRRAPRHSRHSAAQRRWRRPGRRVGTHQQGLRRRYRAGRRQRTRFAPRRRRDNTAGIY